MSKLIQDSTIRNIGDLAEARTGMSKELLLNDTTKYEINNLAEAVDLYVKHLKAKSHIKIYADYDGDGIGSSYILNKLCKITGADYDIKLPDRESDGYGIQEKHITGLKAGDLLICVDNGITAFDAIKKAKAIGCDVLILDHHEGAIDSNGIKLPDADVIVDPHITGGTFDDYCGAGLAFKFAEYFLENRCTAPREKWEPILKQMNVMAAVSTITDSVKLTWENRKIVKDGFKYYKEGHVTTGLKLLCDKLWMPKVRNLSGDDIGFTLGPAWNAAGRLAENGATKVFDVISYEGKWNLGIDTACTKLVEYNDKRKAVSKQDGMSDLVYINNTKQGDDSFIVVYEPDKLPGIAGIRSGKITEQFKVPSIVFTDAGNGLLKGSGRSVPGVDLKKILDKNSHLIMGYGGHPEACGLTIEKSKLEAFSAAVKESVNKDDILVDDNIHFDIEISEKEIPHFINEMNKWGPFGVGNPAPKFLVRDLEVSPGNKGYYIGSTKDTLSLLSSNGIKIMGFNRGSCNFAEDFKNAKEPSKISGVITLGQDEYKDMISCKANLSDFTWDKVPELDERSNNSPNVGEDACL